MAAPVLRRHLAGLGVGGLLANSLMHYSHMEFGWRVTQKLTAATCGVLLASSLLGFWWATRAPNTSRVVATAAPLKRSLSSALKEHGQESWHAV